MSFCEIFVKILQRLQCAPKTIYSISKVKITPTKSASGISLLLLLWVSGIKSDAERKIKEPAVIPKSAPIISELIPFKTNIPKSVPIGVNKAVKTENLKISFTGFPQ